MNPRIKNIYKLLCKTWTGKKAPARIALTFFLPLVMIAFFLSAKETGRLGDIAKERAKLPRPAAENSGSISTFTDSSARSIPTLK